MNDAKRTTFRCPEELLWKAKEKAVRERTTLTEVLVRLLEEYVKEPR